MTDEDFKAKLVREYEEQEARTVAAAYASMPTLPRWLEPLFWALYLTAVIVVFTLVHLAVNNAPQCKKCRQCTCAEYADCKAEKCLLTLPYPLPK